MLRRVIRLPGLPPITIWCHPARRGCEHFCFLGAVVDAGSYLFHIELYSIVLFGKLALAFGALGVYLLHVEEHMMAHHHQQAQDSEV